MGCPSRLLGFSPCALPLSLSGLCENQDAAAREGHPMPSLRRRRADPAADRVAALGQGSSV